MRFDLISKKGSAERLVHQPENKPSASHLIEGRSSRRASGPEFTSPISMPETPRTRCRSPPSAAAGSTGSCRRHLLIGGWQSSAH